MALLRDSPYIWVTWLTKFLAGENSCEQGCLVQVPARRMELRECPRCLRLGRLELEHTAGINERREHRKERVYTVFTEGIMQARTWESWWVNSTSAISLIFASAVTGAFVTVGKTWATASVWEWRLCAPESCGT